MDTRPMETFTSSLKACCESAIETLQQPDIDEFAIDLTHNLRAYGLDPKEFLAGVQSAIDYFENAHPRG